MKVATHERRAPLVRLCRSADADGLAHGKAQDEFARVRG
jgi:hypothetical protein